MKLDDDSASCPTCGAANPVPRSGSLASNPIYVRGKWAVLRSDRWHHRVKRIAFVGLGTGMWIADVLDDIMRFLCKTTDSMLNVVYNWTGAWFWGRATDKLTIIYGWYNVLAFLVAGYLVYRAARWYFWMLTLERLEHGKPSDFQSRVPALAGGWLVQYFAVAIPGNLLLGWIWPAQLPRLPSLLALATFGIGATTLWYMNATNQDAAG
jgi:hypothetical protein